MKNRGVPVGRFPSQIPRLADATMPRTPTSHPEPRGYHSDNEAGGPPVRRFPMPPSAVASAFAAPNELWMGFVLAAFFLSAVLVWCPAPALLLPASAAKRIASGSARVPGPEPGRRNRAPCATPQDARRPPVQHLPRNHRCPDVPHGSLKRASHASHLHFRRPAPDSPSRRASECFPERWRRRMSLGTILLIVLSVAVHLLTHRGHARDAAPGRAGVNRGAAGHPHREI